MISIVLPIYNRAATLPRCLASIQAQTWTDWELIGVDDASHDDSADVFQAVIDPRFRLLRHEANRGPSAARNTALAAARGAYVAFIDSDDEWLPEKLARQLPLLQSGVADGCGCEYWRMEGSDATHHRLPEPGSWAEELLLRCELTGSTLLARRECVAATGPMNEGLRLYEDWEWMLRFVERFRFRVLHEPLARYTTGHLRNPVEVARNAERFLAAREPSLVQLGVRTTREVRAAHFENVAVNAWRQRHFALGARYAWKALRAAPLRRPRLAGALPLAALDALLGTSLLARTAGWTPCPTPPKVPSRDDLGHRPHLQ